MNAPIELAPAFDVKQDQPERDLWVTVLTLLLEDARAYWKGQTGITREQAFDDVLRVGPMLRHCCRFTGHNPQWIAERVVRLLECDHRPSKSA